MISLFGLSSVLLELEPHMKHLLAPTVWIPNSSGRMPGPNGSACSDRCPECGGPLVPASGCIGCPRCGFGKCG